MTDTYRMVYRCSNCSYECAVDLPKGQEAPNFFACPDCGRTDLKVDRKQTKTGGVYVSNGFSLKKAKDL